MLPNEKNETFLHIIVSAVRRTLTAPHRVIRVGGNSV